MLISVSVILDAPTGMTSDVWALVWPKIASHAKVLFDHLFNFKYMMHSFTYDYHLKLPAAGLCLRSSWFRIQ